MTYSDIAERFGISRDAARMLAKRKGWQRKPGNHPGAPIRIDVPDGEQEGRTIHPGERVEQATCSPEWAGENRSPVHPGVHPTFSDMVAMLAAEREHADQRVAEALARADAQAARQLAERDALHLGHVDRLLAQAGMERQLWLERVDAAELRAERVEQRLDQIVDHLLQRQPAPASFWRGFWSRWFGQSKRSEIR